MAFNYIRMCISNNASTFLNTMRCQELGSVDILQEDHPGRIPRRTAPSRCPGIRGCGGLRLLYYFKPLAAQRLALPPDVTLCSMCVSLCLLFQSRRWTPSVIFACIPFSVAGPTFTSCPCSPADDWGLQRHCDTRNCAKMLLRVQQHLYCKLRIWPLSKPDCMRYE